MNSVGHAWCKGCHEASQNGSILRFSCLSVYTWCVLRKQESNVRASVLRASAKPETPTADRAMWNNLEAFPVILLALLIPSSLFFWFLTSMVSFPQHPLPYLYCHS
ncbi:hypothetical protein CK203_075264 [Vitis vinifera]|uniref:Uncharacterized protein n=1 Tax=Vitis vinifera TaxID=29760 RepID=A0A438F670_VITVI|nr:hypothetical protein CK203_075264 [Vitis vinifera]